MAFVEVVVGDDRGKTMNITYFGTIVYLTSYFQAYFHTDFFKLLLRLKDYNGPVTFLEMATWLGG